MRIDNRVLTNLKLPASPWMVTSMSYCPCPVYLYYKNDTITKAFLWIAFHPIFCDPCMLMPSVPTVVALSTHKFFARSWSSFKNIRMAKLTKKKQKLTCLTALGSPKRTKGPWLMRLLHWYPICGERMLVKIDFLILCWLHFCYSTCCSLVRNSCGKMSIEKSWLKLVKSWRSYDLRMLNWGALLPINKFR